MQGGADANERQAAPADFHRIDDLLTDDGRSDAVP
jgi:hypothetical protein